MSKEAAWVRVQIKAFTQWINQTLRDYGGNLQVADLEQDFKDGLVFIRFFSALEPEKNFPKYIQNPKLKVHKLENISKALAFMEKEMGVRNPGIQAEDVLDKDEKSNLKLILGLIWVLFRKYRIAVVSSGSSSAEEGLLNWVKEQTEGYKGVSITKWKDSFNDGLAFAALVHHYDPAGCGFDYNALAASGDVSKVLEAAFSAAERTMAVPRLLEIEDFTSGSPDERSLVLYTSLLFHAYNNGVDREALEAERKRRAAELEAERERKQRLTEENDKLRHQVEELEKTLKKLIVERDELKEKDKFLEEKVDVMKQVIDQETAERDELLATHAKLKEQIEELERRLEIELATKAQGESEMKGKLEEELDRVNKLQKAFDALDEEARNLKKRAEDLNTELDEQRRRKSAALAQLEKDAAFSAAQMSYLGIFKKNLEDHLRDLAKWGSFLDYDKKSTLDFEVDVKAPMSEEMENADFAAQLDQLRGKMNAETQALSDILKSKKIEAEQEAMQKKRGKK